MKNRVLKKSIVYVLSLSALVFLPSCAPWDWIKSKLGTHTSTCPIRSSASTEKMIDSFVDDGSPVLATINGKPVITLKKFEKEFDDFVDKNRLRPIIQFMPDAKEKFLDGVVSQFLIDQEIQARGISQSKGYLDEKAQLDKSTQQMLNTKYFADLYPVKVSDAEMRKFYEENKDKLPDILVSRGGVNALGINFTTDAEAQTFFDKVKNNPNNFVQAAKEAQLEGKVKKFDLITEQTPGVDPALLQKVMSYEQFPKVEVIKVNDKSCWVLYAKEKKAAECRPFEQVKATVEQYVMREKRMEVLEKEIAKLRDKFKATINKSLLAKEQKGLPTVSQDEQEVNDEQEQMPEMVQAA